MKAKVLWASRHKLDPEAEEALLRLCKPVDSSQRFEFEVVSEEILWPSDCRACWDLANELKAKGYVVMAGVWPAQAVEAWIGTKYRKDRHSVISPVSVPETEPDVKKTRPFRFVRWAWIVKPYDW